MKKISWVSVIIISLLLAVTAQAALKMEEITKDEAIKNASPEERIAILNEKVSQKILKYSDLNSELMTQFYKDALASEKDPVSQLLKAAQLKKANPKIPFVEGNYITSLYWEAVSSEKDPTARLVKYGKIIKDNKDLPRVNSAFVSRLYWEALADIKDAAGRIDKYAQLREQNDKLPADSQVEFGLLCQFLATDPKAIDADLLGKVKLVYQLEKAKKVGWGTTANIYPGMLAAYLAADEKYQNLSPEEKLKYLKTLESVEGVVGKLVITKFAKAVAFERLATLPQDKQIDYLNEIEPSLDFFTNTTLNGAYMKKK